MLTSDKIDKFIELRAQGWSLGHIAGELHASKTTLVDWSREYAAEIDSFRSAGLALLQEKVTASREAELDRLFRFQKDVEDELASRPLNGVPLDRLYQIASDLRKEIRLALQEQQPAETPGPRATQASAKTNADKDGSSEPGSASRNSHRNHARNGAGHLNKATTETHAVLATNGHNTPLESTAAAPEKETAPACPPEPEPSAIPTKPDLNPHPNAISNPQKKTKN